MIKMLKFCFLLLIFGVNWASGQENILLITPYDGDTIETKNPMLSWNIMGNPQQNDRSFYRFILVELEKNQSAEAGIIVNQPLILMDKYPGQQLFYPYDAPELEDGHRYGWQVQHIKNNVIVDKSEAWEFILPVKIVPRPQYHKLKVKQDGGIANTQQGKLFFEYDERYQNDDLKFYVYGPDKKLLQAISPHTRKTDLDDDHSEMEMHHTGANYYELDLGEHAPQGIYRLVTINSKKQRYELKFEVK